MDDRIINAINDAEKILVGIGEALNGKGDEAMAVYNKVLGLVEGKDYYVISVCEDGAIVDCGFDRSRLVTPVDENDDYWNDYNNWLGRTLNKRLVLLEIGVGLKYPGVIRWPFEKIAFVNAKAQMFRIHKSLYQTTEELGDKCIGIEADPLEYLA